MPGTEARRGIQASSESPAREDQKNIYELPIPSLYSLLSKAAAKESMSTDVLADSRIAGVGILSPITR